MTVKLYRVIDRAAKVFHINPAHITAVEWDSLRIIFSNGESLYVRSETILKDLCTWMQIKLEDY